MEKVRDSSLLVELHKKLAFRRRSQLTVATAAEILQELGGKTAGVISLCVFVWYSPNSVVRNNNAVCGFFRK